MARNDVSQGAKCRRLLSQWESMNRSESISVHECETHGLKDSCKLAQRFGQLADDAWMRYRKEKCDLK